MSRFLMFVGFFFLSSFVAIACGSGPGENESTEESGQTAACTLAGHWRVDEERVGGDCAPDQVPTESLSIELSELEMAGAEPSWQLQMSRGDTRLGSCSGLPSDDLCRIEITCSRDIEHGKSDYAITLEVDGTDSLEGSGVLTHPFARGEECQAEFGLEGERAAGASTEHS